MSPQETMLLSIIKGQQNRSAQNTFEFARALCSIQGRGNGAKAVFQFGKNLVGSIRVLPESDRHYWNREAAEQLHDEGVIQNVVDALYSTNKAGQLYFSNIEMSNLIWLLESMAEQTTLVVVGFRTEVGRTFLLMKVVDAEGTGLYGLELTYAVGPDRGMDDMVARFSKELQTRQLLREKVADGSIQEGDVLIQDGDTLTKAVS